MKGELKGLDLGELPEVPGLGNLMKGELKVEERSSRCKRSWPSESHEGRIER